MPLGQRVAHVSPKRRLGLLEPCHEVVVGPGDDLTDVEAGCRAALPG
jgi:hypothetical protein